LRAVGGDDADVRSDFGKERIKSDPRGKERLPILPRKEKEPATLAASTVFFKLEEFVEDFLLPRSEFN
jgi:hypothetical protein